MKKIITATAAAVMAMTTLVVPAMAAETQSYDVKLQYGVGESYSISIPESIGVTHNFETGKGDGEAKLSVDQLTLEDGHVLTVRISGHDYVNAWELLHTTKANTILKYTIGKTKGAADIKNNDIVLTSQGKAPGTKIEETLYFNIDGTGAIAGVYEDTLTFTFSVD